jgi:glutamate--cysteine ligase catalytic subunit
MVESTPGRPYSHFASDLLRVERNMTLRRRRLLSALKANEIAPTVTCFPLMGVGDFIANPQPFLAPYSKSIFIPDYIINEHPRFAALTTNIRERRGKKVDIRVPLFRDVNTPEFQPESGNRTVPPGYRLEETPEIYMDCMAFGMGMCCLQVTFQAQDVSESRYLYDQLAVLAPIMLALTAATPIFKGRLADIDARWTVISQSVDDRTDAEKGLIKPEDIEKHADDRLAGRAVRRIPKSRYDSVSTFIYHCEGDPICQRTFAQYNDISCPVEEEFKTKLLENGVDENLAHHVAHIFIRDPIVAYCGKIELNDELNTDHFESVQSTNWQTCRWKPPPFQATVDGQDHIGWRTEFRSMEVQLTDFENAAFTVFILLVNRVLLAFDLGLYIPLSRVDENMRRAHSKNAVLTEKFYFRKYIAPPDVEVAPSNHGGNILRSPSSSGLSPKKFCGCDKVNYCPICSSLDILLLYLLIIVVTRRRI